MILGAAFALVLLSGISMTEAFAQVDPLSNGQAPSSSLSSTQSIAKKLTTSCTLLDFEGEGDFTPIGTIGPATFLSAISVIDEDAGGSGVIANEPSPSTVMAPAFNGGPASMTLSSPVGEIKFYHSSLGVTTVRVYDDGNTLLATIPLAATPPGVGDPNGDIFGTWNLVTHSEGSNVIKRVEFDGAFGSDRTVYDNVQLCFTQLVGGKMLSVDSASLVLAGVQTNAVWIMSALTVIGSVAFGAVYITAKKN